MKTYEGMTWEDGGKDWTVRLAYSSSDAFAHIKPETMVNHEGAGTTEQFITRAPTLDMYCNKRVIAKLLACNITFTRDKQSNV